jgi:formylglycine-generating enzyme required for sulfatase activity
MRQAQDNAARATQSAALLVLLFMAVTSASAQTPPDTEVRIAAYVQQSNALAQAHAARPRPEPYADLRARSARLSAAQRVQAQGLFASAFSVWQAGDYAAAEIGFQQGLEIDPSNGPANFYMGDILRRRGNAAGAADYMTRAVTFAAGSAEGLRAQAALRDLPVPDAELLAPPVIFAPPGEPIVFRDCADCPEMVVVPRGAYTMGSPASEPNRQTDESPQHRVSLSAPFAVGKFEVTRGQYEAFTRATGRALGGNCYSVNSSGRWARDANSNWRNPGFSQDEDHPVVCVSWEDARAYVAWLNTQTRGSYRLLTEAEWEYAARAGSTSAYPWGADANSGCAYANGTDATAGARHSSWTWASTCNDGALNTARVGSYQPNAFGLSDMIGNIWEWTEDCHSAQASGACDFHQFRGGSWGSDPHSLRPANRARIGSTFYINADVGFRVARTL